MKQLCLYCVLMLFSLCSHFSCAHQKKEVQKSGSDLVPGSVSRRELFKEYPSWQKELNDYIPDSSVIQALSKNYDVNVEIFFGTWCKDSRREVPRFYKILDQSRFTAPERVYLWAVDRTKKLKNGLTEKRKIEFVATFIFFREQKEIGRIVEEPFETLEKDILEILTTDQQ